MRCNLGPFAGNAPEPLFVSSNVQTEAERQSSRQFHQQSDHHNFTSSLATKLFIEPVIPSLHDSQTQKSNFLQAPMFLSQAVSPVPCRRNQHISNSPTLTWKHQLEQNAEQSSRTAHFETTIPEPCRDYHQLDLQLQSKSFKTWRISISRRSLVRYPEKKELFPFALFHLQCNHSQASQGLDVSNSQKNHCQNCCLLQSGVKAILPTHKIAVSQTSVKTQKQTPSGLRFLCSF